MALLYYITFSFWRVQILDEAGADFGTQWRRFDVDARIAQRF